MICCKLMGWWQRRSADFSVQSRALSVFNLPCRPGSAELNLRLFVARSLSIVDPKTLRARLDPF